MSMTLDVNVNDLLERFDQTDPDMQRQITAMFAAQASRYGQALREIAECENLCTSQQKAQEALATKFKLV